MIEFGPDTPLTQAWFMTISNIIEKIICFNGLKFWEVSKGFYCKPSEFWQVRPEKFPETFKTTLTQLKAHRIDKKALHSQKSTNFGRFSTKLSISLYFVQQLGFLDISDQIRYNRRSICTNYICTTSVKINPHTNFQTNEVSFITFSNNKSDPIYKIISTQSKAVIKCHLFNNKGNM